MGGMQIRDWQPFADGTPGRTQDGPRIVTTG